jgi:hypothetical protein
LLPHAGKVLHAVSPASRPFRAAILDGLLGPQARTAHDFFEWYFALAYCLRTIFSENR